MRAEEKEMGKWVKNLLPKHETLSLDPHVEIQKPKPVPVIFTR